MGRVWAWGFVWKPSVWFGICTAGSDAAVSFSFQERLPSDNSTVCGAGPAPLCSKTGHSKALW